MARQLSAKQIRFCDEYMVDCNATQAAIRAGYSRRTAERACDWVNEKGHEKPCSKFNSQMADYIMIALQKKHDKTMLTRDEKRQILATVARNPRNTPSDRTRAIDTDNKMQAEYIDRVELTRPIDESIKEMDEYFETHTETDT